MTGTSYTEGFKAQIVAKLTTSGRSVSEIAKEHGLHPGLLYRRRDWPDRRVAAPGAAPWARGARLADDGDGAGEEIAEGDTDVEGAGGAGEVEDAPDDAGVVAGGCLEGADVAEEQAGGGPASPRSSPQPPRSAVTLFTLHGSPATLVALLGGRRAVPPDPVAELLEEALGAGVSGRAISVISGRARSGVLLAGAGAGCVARGAAG
ncbi:MAG: transposase [Nannocystis sp.]|nr:transposase [Nannocystis sp.]